jgi:hypothetical protein
MPLAPASRATLLAAAATLLAAACSTGEKETVARAVRTDSAGVLIATNDSVDRPLGWRFEERFRVGGADEGPEAFYNVWPAGIGADSLDRLYVLDPGNFRVVVFDSTGTVVRTQGAKGGGPGELEFPAFLVVRAGGEVGVFDYSRRGLVRFSSDGAPLPLEKVGADGGPPPDGLRAVSDGFVLARTDYGETTAKSQLLVLRDTVETTLTAVERPVGALHMFKSCGGQLGMRLPPLFERRLVWAELGGRVAVAQGEGYVIDIYDDGRLTRSIRLTVRPQPTDEALARRELGEGMKVRFGGGECTIHPDEVIEVRGMEPTLQAVRTIVIGPDSSLWVERGRAKDDPPVVDVFSADGDYVGTLPAGSPMPALFLQSGDAIALVEDDLDVQRIVACRIHRDEVVRETARR